jgi:hypothetical protein
MTFAQCQLAIIKENIETNKNEQAIEKYTDEIKEIIQILEDFLRRKKLICYGGTAINNILPKEAQFYKDSTDIPDYDFYTTEPMEDAIELANIYHSLGFDNVEAKSGVHFGTFKVSVQFIQIADITLLTKELFDALEKESIEISGIKYASPLFLRMNCYLELSRPMGDITRWEKVASRLKLIEEHYPIKMEKCKNIHYLQQPTHIKNKQILEYIFENVGETIIRQGAMFFGGLVAYLMNGEFQDNDKRQNIMYRPDFDVLTDDIDKLATMIKSNLENGQFGNAEIKNKIKKVEVVFQKSKTEILPDHNMIIVDGEVVARIFKTIACHNYNEYRIGGNKINVATIDTILYFFLAFYFLEDSQDARIRILCLCAYLLKLEHKDKLSNEGLFKRYGIKCLGKQDTLIDILVSKQENYERLKKKMGSYEFKMRFLKYNPSKKENEKKEKKEKKEKTITQEIKQETQTYKKTKQKKKTQQKKTKNAKKKKTKIEDGFKW